MIQINNATKFLDAYINGKLGNPIIILSCKVTSLLFFVGCALTTSIQWFGEPIQCFQNSNEPTVPEKTMNLFCFTSGTYRRLETTEYGRILDYQTDEKQHSFYPWVPFICLLQGLLFMLPQRVGTIKNNSRLEKYIIDSHSLVNQDFYSMARYISQLLNSFNGWVASCVFCEVLYFFIVLSNFYAVDNFFGGSFLYYGYRALFVKEFKEDSLFPKMIRCKFYKYGPSGTVQSLNPVCLLPLNVINEKIYLLIWYWLVILIGVSSYIIIKRVLYLINACVRRKYPILIKATLGPGISWNKFNALNKKLSLSDWMLLEQIKPHLHPYSYEQLLENIAKQITEC